MIWPLVPAFFAGLMLSWALELLLTPRPQAPWRRPASAVAVHTGIWTLAFALEIALFRRPYFAAGNVLALQCVFIIVNNAKYHSLHEPFVYPDFTFFSDAIKHPRLYLPFLGWMAPLAAAAGYGLALWAGLKYEPAVDAQLSTWALMAHAAVLALLGWALAKAGARRLPPSPAFDAVQDIRQLGLAASLWQYAIAERADTQNIRDAAPFAQTTTQAKPGLENLPDIVVVQSESFFDARRLYPQIRREVLANFDLLRSESLQHGQVQVEAWGANTIRTEFGFLTGLTAKQLGVHRFHPYRKLAGQGVATLASYLRSLGYRTICVHPYHGQFYDRDVILPKLGFDEFIDIEAFHDAKRDGPYVGDITLADYVKTFLEKERKQPLYVHVITMENHGPLHFEQVRAQDIEALMRAPLPKGCEDLVAYTRHLCNADIMFGRLRASLLSQKRPGTLCIFGDHVPIMAKVYKQLGKAPGDTDYLLWKSDAREQAVHNNVTLSITKLASVSLELGIGLRS